MQDPLQFGRERERERLWAPDRGLKRMSYHLISKNRIDFYKSHWEIKID